MERKAVERIGFNYRRQWHPTPVLLPGKSHGRRSPVGCSPWGRQESNTTERLHFDFSLLCIGGGNGNPLQCSCLENPRDRGAWWTAVYGVASSRTRLKRLSSSSTERVKLIRKNEANVTGYCPGLVYKLMFSFKICFLLHSGPRVNIYKLLSA